MSEWKARVFWTDVSVREVDGGATIALDDRLVKTPARRPLVVPTPELAAHLAEEWRSQDGVIDPRSMPYTRLANVAIDKVSERMGEVRAHIVEYGCSDLVCYRADQPEALVQRQADAWDPMLEWLRVETGAVLRTAIGVMPVEQSQPAVEAMSEAVADLDAFALTAFSEMVSLSGSFVLALAVSRARLDAGSAWKASRIDEDFQIEQWGDDEEAAGLAFSKRTDFDRAANFLAAI